MNPELQRNLWLELTTHRLLLTPAVILGIALLFHYVDPSDTVVRPVALFGFVVLAVVWGARQAANSVLDEAREHTWNIQRMSALGPWTMTWGKLGGATVMSWYGGLWCLLIYVRSADRSEAGATASAAALVVIAAVAAHAATLMGALLGMHLGSRVHARLSNIVVIVTIALLLFLLPNLLHLVDEQKRLVWYAGSYPTLTFALSSAVVCAAWSLVGAFRTMCIELQVRTRPWVWLGFALFIAGYLTGFTIAEETALLPLLGRLLSSVTVAATGLSYAAAFAFARDPVQYRRVFRAERAGNHGRALEELPLWLSSAALALVCGGGALLLGSAPALTNERPDNLGPAALALVLMMLRDLALLTYFSFRSRNARAAATTLIYIALLDLLLPAILTRLGLGGITSLVRPRLFEAPYLALAIYAAHAAVAITLAVRAYRSATAAINRTGDR